MGNTTSPSTDTSGHRERLRARFLAGEVAATTEVALLELLLTYSIPRRDVRPLAEELLAAFGSVGAVLSAPASELERFPGIKESSTVLLKLVHQLSTLPTPCCVSEPVPSSDVSEVSQESPTVLAQSETEVDHQSSEIQQHKKLAKAEKQDSPKLTLANGYLFESAQNAQVLDFIASHSDAKKITRQQIEEATGLSDRQIESIASITAALDLTVQRSQRLTPWGALLHRHDLFLESTISLEFCHFLGAGRARNLVWHLVFNELLYEETTTDQPGWSNWLRDRLASQYSEGSLGKHIAQEVRFVVDAYTVRAFKKLNLIYETPDKTLALRRYTALHHLSLAAMIYWIGDAHEARLVSFDEIQSQPGSPGRVFGLDASSMRQMIEILHQKGWIRYEVRHGLDQIRLLEGYSPLVFLTAAYEGRDPEPLPHSDHPPGETFLF